MTVSRRRRARGRVRRVEIQIGSATMARAAVAGALVWLLLELWPIVLVVGVALMAVGALTPWITALERRGVRRGPAVAVVFVALFVLGASFALLTAPLLVTQLSRLVADLPDRQAQLANELDRHTLTAPLADSVRGTGSSELMANMARSLFSYSTKLVEFTAYAATSFFLAMYVIIDRDRMRGALFALVPRSFHVRLSRILLNLEAIVGGYVRGQVITSIMMASFTFMVLLVARAPNAATLAALAGVADVLPYVGGVLICAPAVLATWSRGAPTAMTVLLVLVAYQEFESRVIVPRVYGRALRLPSGVILVALLVGGTLLGILGALLALPIAAGIRMVIEELRFELPGEEGGARPSIVARDASAEQAFATRAAGAPAEQAAAIATEIAEAQIEYDARHGADPTLVPLTRGHAHKD